MQVLQYMENMNGGNDIAMYLLRVHFPWVPISCSTNDYTHLYRQAYLATRGMADPQYQSMYDAHIEPILIDKIGKLFFLHQESDYIRLMQYVRKRPYLVRDIIEDNMDVDVTLRAMQLNADTDTLSSSER